METTQNTLGTVLQFENLPEFKGAKDKQQLLVEKNPFIAITDTKTLKLAKESRTALRQGRYDLQKGEKTIATKLKEFRDSIKDKTLELVGITKTAEDKQQAEIERYESEKKKEKEGYLRVERERMQGLKEQVLAYKSSKLAAIKSATIHTIGAIIQDINKSVLDIPEFESTIEEFKQELLISATEKKKQLEEAEQLRLEKEKAKAEREKLEAEKAAFAKTEKERKAKEEAERKKIDAEKAKVEAELQAEREKLEAEKAAFAKAEKERKEKLEAEQKARELEELKRKKDAETNEANKLIAWKTEIEVYIAGSQTYKSIEEARELIDNYSNESDFTFVSELIKETKQNLILKTNTRWLEIEAIEEKANLKAEGKIRIDGTTFQLSHLDLLKAYFNAPQFQDLEKHSVESLKELFTKMNAGKEQGKANWKDLTNLQRENKAKRNSIFSDLNGIVDNLLNDDLIDSIKHDVVTIHELTEYFEKTVISKINTIIS